MVINTYMLIIMYITNKIISKLYYAYTHYKVFDSERLETRESCRSSRGRERERERDRSERENERLRERGLPPSRILLASIDNSSS